MKPPRQTASGRVAGKPTNNKEAIEEIYKRKKTTTVTMWQAK